MKQKWIPAPNMEEAKLKSVPGHRKAVCRLVMKRALVSAVPEWLCGTNVSTQVDTAFNYLCGLCQLSVWTGKLLFPP